VSYHFVELCRHHMVSRRLYLARQSLHHSLRAFQHLAQQRHFVLFSLDKYNLELAFIYRLEQGPRKMFFHLLPGYHRTLSLLCLKRLNTITRVNILEIQDKNS
jgi:hypothetical protein